MIIVSGILFLNLNRTSPNSSLPPLLFPAFEPEKESEIQSAFELPKTLVKVSKTPMTAEVLPGGTLQYVLSIKNISDQTLHNLVVEERFDDGVMSATAYGSGSLSQNRIAWLIPVLEPEMDMRLRYEFHLKKSLPDTFQTTSYVFGDELMDMTSASRMASSTIALIALPQSGVELGPILRWISSIID